MYLAAHALVDENFTFVGSDWKSCIINRNKIAKQTNGYDCGPLSLCCLDYLVAGQSFTFSEKMMVDYRYKILLALKLQYIPWMQEIIINSIPNICNLLKEIPPKDRSEVIARDGTATRRYHNLLQSWMEKLNLQTTTDNQPLIILN